MSGTTSAMVVAEHLESGSLSTWSDRQRKTCFPAVNDVCVRVGFSGDGFIREDITRGYGNQRCELSYSPSSSSCCRLSRS